MAVFRVEKNQNYTVMSNHHLKNCELSLKSKGLFSQMLSLPDNWDYTLAGLAKINREKVDAIRTAIWELKNLDILLEDKLVTPMVECQKLSILFMNIPKKFHHRYWKIQQRRNRYWKIR